MADSDARTTRVERATLVAASLGFAVIQLDVTVVNVAIKPIGSDLGGGISALQWVVDAYTLVLAALILLAGALGDRFGARRMFLWGFAIFAGASAACGLAPDIGVLIGARVVQGVGAGFLGSCSLALINHTFTGSARRASAVGWYAVGASAALSAGPLVGGVLLATLGWRAIFFINLPIGALGGYLIWRFTPETPCAQRRIDGAGAVAAMVALAAFAAAVIEAGGHGLSDPWVLAGFGIALLAAAGFLAIESRSRDPMLPLALLKRPALGLSALIGFSVNVPFYGLIFVFSLLWQSHHGYSPLRTGLAFLPMTLAVMATNLAAARIGTRLSHAGSVLVGIVAVLAGYAGLLGLNAHTAYLAIVGQLVVAGAGLGLVVPHLTTSVLASAERSRSGVASGTLVAARQSGSVLGVALFGALIAGTRFFHGAHTALVLSVAIAAVTAGAAAGLWWLQSEAE